MVDTGNQQEVATPESVPKARGKSPLLIIFFTVLIDLIGFGLIMPILPTYARALHAPDMTAGFLLASYSLAQFLCMPFWGRLSDRVGRRPILLISLTASAVGYLIWGFSSSILMLFVARLVAGAGNANLAVAQAYVADVTTPETRSKGMGAIGAAFGLGFVLGPAIGGLCSGDQAIGLARILVPTLTADNTLAGMQLLGFVAAAFSLLDLLFALFLLPEPSKRSHAGTERYDLSSNFIKDSFNNPSLQKSFWIFFISTFAFANMETTLVFLTYDQFGYTARDNFNLFVYVGILVVLVQGGMIHRLTKKYGEKICVEIGTVLVAVGLILTPLTHSIPGLYVALAFLAFGSGINTPANQSMLSKLAPQERVGGVMGIGQSLSTLGRIVGPAIGATTYQYFGQSCPYLIGAVAMVVAFMLSLQLPKLPAQPKPQAS